MRSVALVSVLMMVLASSAANAANLVTNGQFELAPNFTGWTVVPQAEIYVAGNYGMPASPGGGKFAGKITGWTAESGSITQTVTLTGDGTLTCELFAGAHMDDGSTGRYALVQVFWNGNPTPVAQINQPSGNYWPIEVPPNPLSPVWQSFSVPVTGTGANTLVVQWAAHTAAWTWMCVDNISVVSAGCTNETTIGAPAPALAPSTAPGNGRVLTINGANLDVVTNVQLKQDATTVTCEPGFTKAANQITATFNFPVIIPLGLYDVVLTRDGGGVCPDTISAIGAIDIACSLLPATMNASSHVLQSTVVNLDQTIALIGTDIAPALQSVALRKTHGTNAVIPMTGLTTSNKDSVLVTFDLMGAEAGRYDLVYTWNSCAAASPAEHAGAVLVYANALTNASFEESCTAEADPKTSLCPDNNSPDNPAPKHWDSNVVGSHWGGGNLVRDGYSLHPDCMPDNTVQAITGSHYAGMDLGAEWENTLKVFQTIAAPPVNGSGNTTAPYNIRAEMAINSLDVNTHLIADLTATAKIRLLDGDENGTELASSAPIASRFGATAPHNFGLVADPDYNAVIPAGTHIGSSPRTLTIVIEFYKLSTNTTGGHYNYGFWIDNVRTGPFVPFTCNDSPVWADANFDNFVDMLDFAMLQECLTTGTPGPQTLSGLCGCFDRTGEGSVKDSMVNEMDVQAFINCATGPQVPWTKADACVVVIP